MFKALTALAVITLMTMTPEPAWAQAPVSDYGSFDSFDPAGDFSRPEAQAPPPPRPVPPPPVEPPPVEPPEPAASEFVAPPEEYPVAEPAALPKPPDKYPPAAPAEPAAIVPPPLAVSSEQLPPPLTLSEAVNYGQPDNWLARPASPDQPVDVFFLYTGSCERAGQGAVCAPNDPGMRQKAQESLRQQAGAFETVGNIFAPYYRQVNSAIFLGLSPKDRAERLAVSVADSMGAFDYYLKNYNGGRPFILAAHGQGSAALLAGILAEYFKARPEARARLVAAYALGYAVTSDYLSANDHLKFAERSDDIGVIVSYSTEAPALSASSPVTLPRAVAINPVNWARSEIPARADRSLGANLSAFGGEDKVENFADARVRLRRGVVECSTADRGQYGQEHFPAGAFPGGDYAFYYYDLRANAQKRVEAFQSGRGRM